MTTWDDHEAALALLVVDAVADVEPDDALADLRARTRTPARRRWVIPAASAALVAAAVVVVVAVLGNDPASPPAPDPAPSVPSVTGETTSPDEGRSYDLTVYWAGDTSQGPRLFRETVPTTTTDQPAVAAVRLALQGGSLDPDYHSLWPEGVDVTSVTNVHGVGVTVSLEGAPAGLPSGMSDEQARLAIQQVVRTATDGVDAPGLTVLFTERGLVLDRILGQDTSRPVDRSPDLETLNQVLLAEPSEGEVIRSGDAVQVNGEAASFEGNVTWLLQRYQGTEVLSDGFFTAEGGDGFYPFSGEVDLTGVPAGRYTLMVSTDDPSGEGNFFTDSRVITVE